MVGSGLVIFKALCCLATIEYAWANFFSLAFHVFASNTSCNTGVNFLPSFNLPKAVPSHLLYGAYCLSIKNASFIISRTRRAATTLEELIADVTR